MQENLPELTLDMIRDADDSQTVPFPVPEWGGTLTLRTITKGEHQDARRRATVRGDLDQDKFELELLLRGIASPVFDEHTITVLRKKNVAIVEAVLRRVLGLAGLTQERQAELDRRFPD